MIKQLFSFIYIFAIFILSFFFQNDISVSVNAPSEISPGKEAIIEITINKGSTGGFAKFQQILPEGFTAEEIDSKGGTFTFINQKAKIIWMALPSDPSFTIKYKIKTDNNLQGNFSINGVFACIINNEKQSFDIPAINISIPSQEISSNVSQDTNNKTTDTQEQNNMETNTQTTEELTETETNVQETANVKCERKMPESIFQQNSFIVNITIDKDDLDGFGKIQETLPQGFTAEEINSSGAIFSFENNLIKILWMSLPSDKTINISYKVNVPDNIKGEYKINGVFTYIEDSKTKKQVIQQSVISIDNTALETAETNQNSSVSTNESEAKNNLLKEEKSQHKQVTSVPSPQKGVFYKVQIEAAHKKVDLQHFKKYHKFYEQVNTENNEGWYKYTTGKFDVYKKARDKRNEINKGNHKFKGPFVTAYNNGIRITVQEALMITGQKWYK